MGTFKENQEQAKELMSVKYNDNNAKNISYIREQYSLTTEAVLNTIKSSRERELALNKLEESCMWAIKSISREND